MPSLTEKLGLFEQLMNRLILVQNTTTVQFEKFTLEKCKESDLFSGVLSCVEDCILVSGFIETNGVIDSDGTETSKLGDADDDDDADAVVGSPLRLHDYLVDMQLPQVPLPSLSNAATVSRRPVCLKDARWLVSVYNMAYQQYSRQARKAGGVSWPHMWVLCDGKDKNHTAYLSASAHSAVHSHMQPSLSGRNYSTSCHGWRGDEGEGRLIVSGYVITSTGPLTEQCRLPCVETLVHELILKKPHKVSYVAEYELISHMPRDSAAAVGTSDVGNFDRHGSIDATVEWSQQSALLQHPPHDVLATLVILPVSGNPRSSVRTLHNDLCTLQGFVGGLSSGLVQWSVVDSDYALLDRVKCLVEDQKVVGAVRKTDVQRSDGDDKDLSLKCLQVIDRQDLDFTEQLWTILRDCSSHSDLVSCLQYVIDCLRAGTLQPMVHKQNVTKLAELIRDSYKGRCDPLFLKRVSALTLLVEIGIDKLFRDYVHAFLEKELVTMHHLSKLVTDSDRLTIEDRVGCLVKLHHVLEMTVMLQQCLNLPQHLLSTAARMALKYYDENAVSDEDVFRLSVPSAAISAHLNNCRPRLWKVDYVSATHCGDVHASVTLSLTPTFTHLSTAAAPPHTDSSPDQKKYSGYYVTAANEFADVV